MYSLLLLLIAAVLGFIPAYIAKEKGYSFSLWWFYGWMLFIVAIIHVSCLPDKAQKSDRPTSIPYSPSSLDSKLDDYNE